MANPMHIEIVTQGAKAIEAWRKGNPFSFLELIQADLARSDLRGTDLTGADLTGADLTEADLSGANLSRANLRESNLRGANLNEADLFKADLCRANLSKAELKRADLCEADLREANLSEASLVGTGLIGANLSGANLNGGDLRNARLLGTLCVDLDLTRSSGLESVIHLGPSHLSVDTLMKSKGQIPESFLRGCGLSEEFISYIPSLFSKNDIKFNSCFISHSHADKKFAQKLAASLQDYGIRTWLDEVNLIIGESISKQIERGIHESDKVVVILSSESIQSSWIQHEINKALEMENKTNKNILFPITIDDSIFSEHSGPFGSQLRDKYILHFEDWTNSTAYKSSLSRLAKSLVVSSARDTVEDK